MTDTKSPTDPVPEQEDQHDVATDAIARLSDTWCESMFMLADLSPGVLEDLYANMASVGWDARLIDIIKEAVMDTQHDDALEQERNDPNGA